MGGGGDFEGEFRVYLLLGVVRSRAWGTQTFWVQGQSLF